MQFLRYAVVALNLWGHIVVNVLFWLFFVNAAIVKEPKLVLESNLRLPRYVLSIFILRLRL